MMREIMNQKIDVFLKIIELGSFSKAADALFMTQPAVSQFVKSLEKELGVILFDRSSKTIQLTDAGQIAFQYFKEMKKLSESMIQSIDELMNEVKGPLIKGAVGEGVGITLLSKWTVQEEAANKKLFIIDEARFFYERDFYLVYLKNPFQLKTMETFIQFIGETSKIGDEL